ncbi:MAG: hypothetical protein IAF38_05140 [Bacteroidia bacterium]|nr:hypothetical protein [Bacteroidia bacterium]
MKIFTLLAFAGIILLSSFSVSKKNPLTNNEEVVIAISNMNSDDLALIKKKFTFFAGVTYKGFCEDQKVIALRVDRTIVPDNKSITDALLSIKENFKLNFKTATFDELQDLCLDKEKLFTR